MIVPNFSIRGVLAAPALLLTLLLAACGAPSEPGAPADSAAPTTPAGPAAVSNDTGSGPIRIGQFSSLSGSEATFGISTDNGIKLALEEQNAAGGVKGRTIEMTTYDTQGKDAGTPVTRLITSDKVVAVLGEVASSLSIAGGRVAQQYGVPLISPASTNPQVTMIGDMVFRVCFIDPYQGYVAAKFLHDNQQMTRVAVLYDQTQAYSKGLRDFFTKAFVELGGQITIEQAYTGGDQDFTAQLTSIRESNPQAIYCPGYYTDIGNIALQARKLGITVPMMGGDGWDSVKLPEIAGPAIEGSFYSNHYSPQDTRPEVKAFVDKYEKTYGQTPDALAALGYDAAKILFAAMERAPSLSGADLAKAISETKGHSGVTGMISLDAQRNAMKSAVVVKLEGGKPVFVTNVDPPKAD